MLVFLIGEANNAESFRLGEIKMAQAGYDVINPIDIIPQSTRSRLRKMLECHCVHLLTGWELDAEARLQFGIAHKIEMAIV